MTRLELDLELVAHRLIGEEIVSLSREKPAHRDLVVLIGLDSQLAAMVPVGDERLVKLLNSKREREILGVAVPDVANEAMKYAV